MRMLLIALVALLLAACSKPPEPQADADHAAAPAKSSTVHRATPFDTMLKSEDKARGVEKTLKDADDKRRKALEDAGG